MLSLHYANDSKSNKRQFTSDTESTTVMDRMAWLEWVRKSRRSHSNLIDQEEVDPQIERHMACVNRFVTDMVTTAKTPPTKPTMNSQIGKRRISVKRSSFVDSKLEEPKTDVDERPKAARQSKRKEPYHRNSEQEPLLAPQLVRVTTSMVLDYQEGIWQTIQLERQAHLPPPANHQKRRYIQDELDSSIDTVAEDLLYIPSDTEKEMSANENHTRQSSCPVCSSSVSLPLVEEIYHCDSCGAFASAELVRSLAHDSSTGRMWI